MTPEKNKVNRKTACISAPIRHHSSLDWPVSGRALSDPEEIFPIKGQLRNGSLGVIKGIMPLPRSGAYGFREVSLHESGIFLLEFLALRMEPSPFELDRRHVQMPVMKAGDEPGQIAISEPPVRMDTVPREDRAEVLPFSGQFGGGRHVGAKPIIGLAQTTASTERHRSTSAFRWCRTQSLSSTSSGKRIARRTSWSGPSTRRSDPSVIKAATWRSTALLGRGQSIPYRTRGSNHRS